MTALLGLQSGRSNPYSYSLVLNKNVQDLLRIKTLAPVCLHGPAANAFTKMITPLIFASFDS